MAEWEEVLTEPPVGGYGSLVHRLRVPGGYLYKETTMYVRGLLGPRFTTSMAFVPDPPKSELYDTLVHELGHRG